MFHNNTPRFVHKYAVFALWQINFLCNFLLAWQTLHSWGCHRCIGNG